MRLMLCFLWGVMALQAKPLELELSARSAILMNADSGAVLFEKHAHLPSYPASTTKIATALFVLDHKKASLDQLVTVSGEALKIKPAAKGDYPPYWDEAEGTKMGLLRGEELSLEALLHGLMMVSGNDAANALAACLSPSIPEFTQELNQYILSLGCHNTQFMNPHGIHHPEHVTTAHDLALITQKALKLPKFREIVSKLSYSVPKTNKRPLRELKQRNALLKRGKHFYPKAIGVKTGYHSNAQNTLVAAAEDQGRTLIAVVFGCQDRKKRYEEAIQLFEAAFTEEKQTVCFLGAEHLLSYSIEGAKAVLTAALRSDLTLSFYPAEEPTCKAFVQWDSVPLPVRKGQKVGEVRLQDEKGRLLASKPIYAQNEVKGKWLFLLKNKIKSLF